MNRKAHQQVDTAVWRQMQAAELSKLRRTQHHLMGNVCAYVLISAVEYYLALRGHSQTLRADAFNNLTGIISTVLLMIGIFISRDMDDDDFMGAPLPQDSYHYQTVFTMITGIVMMMIAVSVIYSGSHSLFVHEQRAMPQPLTLAGATFALLTMLVVWWVNLLALTLS